MRYPVRSGLQSYPADESLGDLSAPKKYFICSTIAKDFKK